MLLDNISMKELLVLHNKIANKPLGPKSFATKDKLINRIEQIAETSRLDLASIIAKEFRTTIEFAKQIQVKPIDDQYKKPIHTTLKANNNSKTRGKGIGELAKQLLLDGQHYSYKAIVEIINNQIPEANTSVNAIRWYACKLKKAGINIVKRTKVK